MKFILGGIVVASIALAFAVNGQDNRQSSKADGYSIAMADFQQDTNRKKKDTVPQRDSPPSLSFLKHK